MTNTSAFLFFFFFLRSFVERLSLGRARHSLHRDESCSPSVRNSSVAEKADHTHTYVRSSRWRECTRAQVSPVT